MTLIDSDPTPDVISATPSGPKRARRAAAPAAVKNPQIQPLPRWARLPDAMVAGAEAAFHGGTGLALVDMLLRSGADGAEPIYVGALRRRLALQAPANCAHLARLREDESAVRDAEHLAPDGAPTSPAGRLHRPFRLFGGCRLRVDRAKLGAGAELAALRLEEATLTGLVGSL